MDTNKPIYTPQPNKTGKHAETRITEQTDQNQINKTGRDKLTNAKEPEL